MRNGVEHAKGEPVRILFAQGAYDVQVQGLCGHWVTIAAFGNIKMARLHKLTIRPLIRTGAQHV